MPRTKNNKKKKGNKKIDAVVNSVATRRTALTTTATSTPASTTTPRSRNNKQRSTSDRTTIVIIGMFFVMGLLYPAVGTYRFSMIQKQLLQPIQDQPLLDYNDNKYDNKVNDDKKESEKEIASKPDSKQKQRQKRLSTKLVRAKKVSLKESNTTTAVVAMMKRSNNKNNNNGELAFDSYGFNQQKNGFIKIDDNSSSVAATKLHNDIETCFSPLLSDDTVKSTKRLKGVGHQNFICHLDGIGSFQIMKCIRYDVCFIESRDEEDYGTPYFMKLGPSSVLRVEMEVIHYLTTINNSTAKNLTPKPHPRYPYIGWTRIESATANTTNDKKNKYKKKDNAKSEKKAVIFEECLNFSRLDTFINKLQTMDQIMSSSNQKQIVQCWSDVLTVTEALWDYQGGHYIHDDIHNGNIVMVPITKRGDNNTNDTNNDADDMDDVQYRCHVIDFGKVSSLDEVRKYGRKSVRNSDKNPFWYTQLSKKHKIRDYISAHSIEEYYNRGWEFSVTQWGQTLFLKQLLKIVFGDNLFNKNKYFDFNINTNMNTTKKYTKYDITVAGWCQASKLIRELVHTLEQYQKQRPDLDDAIIHMVIEQSTIIEKGVSILNCTDYEAVLVLPLT